MDRQLMNERPPKECLIELTLPRLGALFKYEEALSCGSRNLNRRVHEYFMPQARLMPGGGPLRLIVRVPVEETALAGDTFQLLRDCLEHLSQVDWRKVRETFREGRSSLPVGLAFLVIVNAVAERIIAVATGRLMQGIASGLEIFGWVAMWRPAELLLYDWIPVPRRAGFWSRLAGMHPESRAINHPSRLADQSSGSPCQ